MAYREFVDKEGTSWRAWDTRPHSAVNVRAGYAGGWLSFECLVERRRLRPVPEGWTDAGEEEMWQLLAAAESVGPVGETRVPLRDVGPKLSASATVEMAVAEAATQPAASALLESTRETVRRARAVIQLVNVTIAGHRMEDSDPRDGGADSPA